MADEQQAEQPLSPVVEAPPPSGPRSLADAEASAKAALAKAVAAKPANENGAPPPSNDNGAQPPAQPTEAEPAKPAEPEPAEELAKYIREARRLREEQRKFEAERAKYAEDRKSFEAEAAALRSAKELIAKGDRLGAIKALGGDQVADDLFWDMVQGYKGAEQLTPEQIAQKATEAALKRLEAERKAEAEAQEKYAQETWKTARSQYVDALATAYRADVAKYPMLREYPLPADTLMELVDAAHRSTGTVPDPAAVLERAESEIRNLAERLSRPYSKVNRDFFASLFPAQQAAPPVRTITSALQRDSRGAVPSDGRRMSYAEREEATKRAIADALRSR